jgi:hypothetical protein
LNADTTLAALVPGGIMSATPDASRLTFPYVVVGRRTLHAGVGAMQREGGIADLFIDVFSSQNDPSEAHAILARIRTLLQRVDLVVSGYTLYSGSIACVNETCYQDFDADMPTRSLFHGIQEWTADLEESQ